jgi:peptidase M1-like protein
MVGTSGCSVPLAPGYSILKESRQVEFVPGAIPQVQFTGHYTLENSGTTDLEFIDVDFPDEETYGRRNLRVEMDGQPQKLINVPDEYQSPAQNTLRMPLNQVWRRGEKRECRIDYTFSSPHDSGTRISISEDSFHLGWRGWSPVPQPLKHFLSPFPVRPPRTIYTVRVPSDFLVLGGGKQVGRKHSGAQADYRFQLRTGDLTPFVVAGRYVASPSRANLNTVIFWTHRPLGQNPQPALERIRSAWDALENDFGPLDKNIHVPHIVESEGLREHLTGNPGPSATAFPGGVLVNSQLLSQELSSDRFLEPVTHALAHNWFGDEVFFARYSALGLGEGLPEYATIVVEEAQNGEAGRQRRVLRYLREYDEARKSAEEDPLGTTTLSDPPEQQRIALAKAPLFLIALEDACGEGAMRSGLKRLVTLLRGQEIAYDTVRSALEESSGKNLADLFRVWLNEKGIPPDFRSRYEREADAASTGWSQ